MSRETKDSGIDWIGEIPRKWKVTKMLNFLRSPITDGPHETPTYVDTGVPFISVNSIDEYGNINRNNANKISKEDAIEYNKKTQLSKGDILFTKSATIGKTAIVDKVNFMVWSPIAVLKPKETLDNRYLKYILDLKQFIQYVSNLGTRNTQINVGMRALEKAKIVIPPHSVQIQIANFLDEKTSEIDKIAEKTKQSIEELKAYKQSLITETVTKGLNPEVPMKDSEIEGIGKIPKHWTRSKLKYILSNQKNSLRVGPFGSHLKNSDFTPGGKWVYNQRTVLDNNFCTNDTFISEDKYKEMDAFKVEKGDILLTTRGTIGKVARVPTNYFEGVIHSSIIKFKIDEEKFRYDLLEIIFNESSFVKNQINLLSNATTIEVIYSNTLKNIYLPIMPMDEQTKIVNYLDEKTEQIDNLVTKKEKMVKELESYKQSLIYEYVTGKKEVK